MIITLDHIAEEAPSIFTYHFKSQQPVRYTAGQFVELTIKHDPVDDRGTRRWFTLSSSPSQDLLAITTKFATTKGSRYKKALHALKPGAELIMSDPMGDFVLPKLLQTPLIFVAGGIGITPFHSMLQWLSDTGEQRPIRMLVGVRNENEIIFQNTYDAAGQHVTLVVDQPSASWGGERGKLTAELILGLKKPSDDTLIYVSGPEAMVETLHKDLIKAGVDKRQLVGDYFPNYIGY
jgi:ferredoxin-NADP reductase